ncbi:tetratricopeptide repeat protein [Rhodopirellula sp. JC740]|uniref:Tetratricopeptide repeat protein n=1 Tax=Rhodopirellula halodulae TaxID=2894198 RepID=A0ABS8NP63_9BACT|nr:tetratricopeptide repeat protein [Rhodopirellula sp. JC740]MCC9645291.1 tetratricopeptide repeat protein [Rhodopirellula sp. JC740]
MITTKVSPTTWDSMSRHQQHAPFVFAGALLILSTSNTPWAWAQNSDDGHAQRHRRAIEIAQINLRPTEPGLANRSVALADALLRAGRAKDSVKHYEQAIQERPSVRPYLWQYGIALFFVERFEDGRELFEAHRKVNPNDVENAAWHFLCEAKANGIDSARKLLLPAPGDRRIPMSEILARLPGGDDSGIEEAAKALPPGASQQSARFYADLYLGLIADAEGDQPKAKRHMQLAAQAPLNHYMADIARVYATHLNNDRNRKATPQ